MLSRLEVYNKNGKILQYDWLREILGKTVQNSVNLVQKELTSQAV